MKDICVRQLRRKGCFRSREFGVLKPQHSNRRAFVVWYLKAEAATSSQKGLSLCFACQHTQLAQKTYSDKAEGFMSPFEHSQKKKKKSIKRKKESMSEKDCYALPTQPYF